uniref:Secreted protein n=1 Tax=Panagrellus redivivus TaxID=6233 RepID=A0A7E4UPX1_PANRE
MLEGGAWFWALGSGVALGATGGLRWWHPSSPTCCWWQKCVSRKASAPHRLARQRPLPAPRTSRDADDGGLGRLHSRFHEPETTLN